MSSQFGTSLKIQIFGQSHAPAIGVSIDGFPVGFTPDMAALDAFLARRAPGQGAYATARKEADKPEFLSGLVEGHTCGAPITAIIRNTDTRSKDYGNIAEMPRPSHADYPAWVKYGDQADYRGGGHFSGRLTAPLCIAGGLCKQWLEELDIHVGAHIYAIGGIPDTPFDPLMPQLGKIGTVFPVLSEAAGAAMRQRISATRAEGDSVGGVIECAVTGLPAGIGEPMFGGVESRISAIVYGIPAVKGVEFGSGFQAAALRGSVNNDAYLVENGRIRTQTNNCGGILGGITNGMPLIFRAAFKPTPSISRPQQSVSISRMEQTELIVRGRHDPCIVPRAVPVVESAAAIAIFDLILGNTQSNRRKQ